MCELLLFCPKSVQLMLKEQDFARLIVVYGNIVVVSDKPSSYC